MVNSTLPATELAERLTRCQYEPYRGLNIFVENLNEFSTYFVIDGLYKNLLTSDTAENGAISWWTAKQWIRVFLASEDEDD